MLQSTGNFIKVLFTGFLAYNEPSSRNMKFFSTSMSDWIYGSERKVDNDENAIITVSNVNSPTNRSLNTGFGGLYPNIPEYIGPISSIRASIPNRTENNLNNLRSIYSDSYDNNSNGSNNLNNSNLNKLDLSKDIIAEENDSDNLICQICYTNKRNVVILPCNHSSTCIKCTKQICQDTNKCPICRKDITDTIFYFIP